MHAFGNSRQVVTLAYLNLSENKLHEGNKITTTYSNPKWHGLIFTKMGREEGVGGGGREGRRAGRGGQGGTDRPTDRPFG